MNDYVATPDMRILLVLARLCTRQDKLYTCPSLQTIRELVWRFTARSISQRSLCRHLGALVRDGWITRQRRHRTSALGTLELHSTLYIMRRRTVKWVRSLGTNLWAFSLEAARSLMHIAMPELAQTLAQDVYSYTHRAAHGPPKR